MRTPPIHLPPVALAVAAISACIAPSHQLTVLDPTPRSPRPLEAIEVFTEEPERPYRVVAMWEGKEESLYGDQIDQLRTTALERAAELGADAAILAWTVDSGMPIRVPSMVPGVATGGLETTSFETVSRMKARLVVWHDGDGEGG